MTESRDLSLYELFFPKEIIDHFELTSSRKESDQIVIVLKEKNQRPPEHTNKKLVSKGFFRPVQVQDFPVRDKKVFLEVYRRRWYDPDNDQYLSRSLQLTADGTSLTKEFADFLKEVDGPIPDQFQPTGNVFPGKR